MPRLSLLLLLALVSGTLTAGCAQARPIPTTRAWVPPAACAPLAAPAPAPTPAPIPAPTRPCTAPPSAINPTSGTPPAGVPGGSPYASTLQAGTSVEGRPIVVHVRGRGREVVLVMATIHGNEPAGTPIAEALLAHLDRHPELLRDRQVLVMPNANPDGHARGTRANAHGVDVNRNFEAPNRRDSARNGERALSEPEARTVERVVRLYGPTRILSLHQPLRCVDWDGPAEALARRVSTASGLPLRKLGTRPGSFGAWAEAEGVALVTLELPPGVQREGREALWERYGDAVLEVVRGSP